MGKAGQRRLRKLARKLAELARDDKAGFLAEWDRRVQGWLRDIRHRGEVLRGKDTSGRERVFEVVEHVNQLLKMCGPEVESLVGPSSRETLIHECCKVFALATDPRLYKIYNRQQYIER
jgi:hypothetical protein